VKNRIVIESPNGTFHAYISRPAKLPVPVVVVLQELFGVNADVRATCDELAAQGFIAIAPLRSGASWRDLPDIFGPYTTCYNRFVRWRRAGVWNKIMSTP
jgi:carboxymethylenebutenolidase